MEEGTDSISCSDSETEIENEQDERELLIKQINNYHKNFPDILNKKAEKKVPLLKKYSKLTPIETLKQDLNDAQTTVASQNMIKDVGALCVSAAYGLQNIGNMIGLKLAGPKIDLATIVHQNKQAFDVIVKELACKYDLMGMAQPEIRLGLLASQCILVVHSTNTQPEKPEEINPKGELKSE
jgi:hypothetical protein